MGAGEGGDGVIEHLICGCARQPDGVVLRRCATGQAAWDAYLSAVDRPTPDPAWYPLWRAFETHLDAWRAGDQQEVTV